LRCTRYPFPVCYVTLIYTLFTLRTFVCLRFALRCLRSRLRLRVRLDLRLVTRFGYIARFCSYPTVFFYRLPLVTRLPFARAVCPHVAVTVTVFYPTGTFAFAFLRVCVNLHTFSGLHTLHYHCPTLHTLTPPHTLPCTPHIAHTHCTQFFPHTFTTLFHLPHTPGWFGFGFWFPFTHTHAPHTPHFPRHCAVGWLLAALVPTRTVYTALVCLRFGLPRSTFAVLVSRLQLVYVLFLDQFVLSLVYPSWFTVWFPIPG